MKTSLEWWNEVKASPALLENWLKDQYHGEVTAAARIQELADRHAQNPAAITLVAIASQEADHAEWVRELLLNRGIKAEVLDKEERYWSKTLPADYINLPIQKLAAIGAHAEAMRLERIRTIVADETAPGDIRQVFKDILKQEEFHERAFRKMAGEEEMACALDAHVQGLAALGLKV